VLSNILGFKAKSGFENERWTLRDANSGLGMLSQPLFTKLLCLERKRTERSGRRFVLMLLDPGKALEAGEGRLWATLLESIWQSTRDTDLKGWYKEGVILGVIFTEIGAGEDKSVVESLSAKVIRNLQEALSIPEMNEIKLSFHVFPEDWTDEHCDHPVMATLRTALGEALDRQKGALGVKRAIDIAGSIVGLTLSAPLMLLIAIAIKLTSEGPVLFKQVRLGRHERRFTFLKFRSMFVNNDDGVHREYMARFIVGSPEAGQAAGKQQHIYKLTADRRITPLGRFLRKTSLDELPQFLNVLWGDMSLVGPRPPVLYEFNRYHLWHRQRLLAVKPGITGLWQVDGRSRVTFDEMVRLDIRYARTWSLWLDLKILAQTPQAVISGSGAC
jgi:lipopolysaccharide/colanic/teichoic acid biosynthesis glycosyltransferase